MSVSQPSNLLHVSIETFGPSSARQYFLAATTASRVLHFLDFQEKEETTEAASVFASDSPILSVCALPYSNMAATALTTMSGKLIIYEHNTGTVLSSRSDHTKYIPRIAVAPQRHPMAKVNLATAGWDRNVFFSRLPSPSMFQDPKLGEPIAELLLPTMPEAILYVRHPETDDLIFLLTRRDSTNLYYYSLPESHDHEPQLLGTQNLAPHSNAWIAFSPSSITICPTDPSLLAVATSSIPHMKLMIVRLLFPPVRPSQPSSPAVSSRLPDPTQASQARAELDVQNREEAAILINVSTLAPQTPYSTPQVVWRPDGSGVWVNGDDGAIRGGEAKTGKSVAVLKDGHEAGSKVRTLWAGSVRRTGPEGDGTEDEEILLSGGFDHKLLVWRYGDDGVMARSQEAH